MDAIAANRPTDPDQRRPFSLNWPLLGAMCAVVWSCYTTGTGIYNIVGQSVFGAVFLTAVVQLTLATVSWFLGKDLAHWATGRPQAESERSGLRSVSVYIILFALTFFISAFFSFNFYFTNLYHNAQEKIALRNEPQREDSEFMPPLRKAVEEAYVSDARTIAAEPATQAWSKSIEKILSEARKPDSQAKLQQLLADSFDAKARLPSAEADLKKKQDIYAKLLQDVQAKQDELAAAQTKVADAQKVADDEAAGRAGSGKPGRGREFDKDGRVLADAQKAERFVRDELDRLNKQVAQASKDIQDARKQVETLQQKAGGGGGLGSASTVAGEIAEVAKLRDDFLADPRLALYDAVVGPCKPLLAALQIADPKNTELAQANCESFDVARRLKARDELLSRRDKFNASCSIDQMAATLKGATGNAGAVADKEKAALLTVQGKIQNCFALAADTGAEISSLRGRFNFDIEANSPDLDAFTRTLHALPFSNATPSAVLSYFAGLISVVQDLFILALSFLAERLKVSARPSRPVTVAPPLLVAVADRDDDAPEIRAAKTLLRLSMPAPGSESKLIVDINTAAWAGVGSSTRDNVAHTLRSLQRQGHVRALGVGKFELSLEGILALEHAIASHADQLASARPMSPTEPEPAGRQATVEASAHSISDAQAAVGPEAPGVRQFTARQAFDEISRSRAASAPTPPGRVADDRSLAKDRSVATPSGAPAASVASRGPKDPRKARTSVTGASDDLGPLEARLTRSVGSGGTPPPKKEG